MDELYWVGRIAETVAYKENERGLEKEKREYRCKENCVWWLSVRASFTGPKKKIMLFSSF